MTRPARRTGISIQRIGDEAVLHDSERQLAHVVNHSAAWIWERIDGTNTTEQIAAQLAEQFGVSMDVARNDVRSVTASFRQLQLLE